MDSTNLIDTKREESQGGSMEVGGREDEKQRRVLSGTTPGRSEWSARPRTWIGVRTEKGHHDLGSSLLVVTN